MKRKKKKNYSRIALTMIFYTDTKTDTNTDTNTHWDCTLYFPSNFIGVDTSSKKSQTAWPNSRTMRAYSSTTEAGHREQYCKAVTPAHSKGDSERVPMQQYIQKIRPRKTF